MFNRSQNDGVITGIGGGSCPAHANVIHMQTSTMADVKFMVWNVRGLRDKIKRTAVLRYLKGQKVDIVVLVETHVTGHLQAALKRPWVGWAYHSTHTNMSRGVTVRNPHHLSWFPLCRIGRAGTSFCIHWWEENPC